MSQAPPFSPASLTPDGRAILDSAGRRVCFDDPRIVHVWPFPMGPTLGPLMRCLYERVGLRMRGYQSLDLAVLQEGRNICSGRECLPVNAIAGLTHRDLTQVRQPGELTLYYWPDQAGPCQNGAWPVVIDTFVARQQIRDAVFMIWLSPRNDFFGQGRAFGQEYLTVITLANLLDEVESALRATALDPEQALASMQQGFRDLLAAACRDQAPLHTLLGPLVRCLQGIPRRCPVAAVPKILLFGGLNLIFVQAPIRRLLEEQGVAVRWLGIAEGMAWVASEAMVRHGVLQGKLRADQQLAAPAHLLTLGRDRLRRLLAPRRRLDERQRSALRAARAWLGVHAFDETERRLRRLLAPTGLVFDRASPFADIAAAGDQVVCNNTFTETTITVGRYRCAAASGVFDGLLDVGSFNCQPAQNSIAAIRAIADQSEVPFAAIDCDGSEPNSSQIRVLENLVVQARRHHARRRR